MIKARTPGIIGRYNCCLADSRTGLACPWGSSRSALATAVSRSLRTFGIAYTNQRCTKFGPAYFRTATSMFDNCIPNPVASSQLTNCVSKQLFHLCSCNTALLAPFRSSSIMRMRITWLQLRSQYSGQSAFKTTKHDCHWIVIQHLFANKTAYNRTVLKLKERIRCKTPHM